jgi:hypothetical protein
MGEIRKPKPTVSKEILSKEGIDSNQSDYDFHKDVMEDDSDADTSDTRPKE